MTRITLRKANIDDAKRLFDWRNDDETRQNMFDSQRLEWQDHLAWFERKIEDTASRIFILTEDEKPLGAVRFHMQQHGQKVAEVSINLDKTYRNRGYGTKGLKLSSGRFWQEANPEKIIAYIKKDNVASVRSFTKAGFIAKGSVTVKGHECHLMEYAGVFLATTALEDFWDTSKPIVFLNSGCTRYSRRQQWSNLQHDILVHPFKDRTLFDKAYGDIVDFTESVLPSIARSMNKIHGTNASERYWRIMVGLWLVQFTAVVYERYVALRDAFDQYGHLSTVFLNEEDLRLATICLEFTDWCLEDWYNLQLYTRILKAMGTTYPSGHWPHFQRLKVQEGFKEKAKDTVAFIVRKIAGRRPVFLRSPFIPLMRDKLYLTWLTGGRAICDIDTEDDIREAKQKDVELRKQLMDIDVPDTEFGKVFKQIWGEEIPLCYVENFKAQYLRAASLYPFVPKHIVTAVGLCHFETFKFWAASCAEQGTKLYGIQHGGNYGLCVPNASEEHERKINDVFYSWGWEAPKVRPMPVTKYLGLKPLESIQEKTGIIYSSKRYARYLVWFEHDRFYDDEEYFDDQKRFMDSLPVGLRREVRLRLYRDDYGWDLIQRWKDHDPSVNIEEWGESFQKSMLRRRLHVTDYPMSTFVDSLAVNMPTILFWPQERFKILDVAKPYLDRLRGVEVLFDSPVDAANLVVRIYDDVESWWREDKRQQAVNDFIHHFARISPSGFKDWAVELQGLV